MNEKQAIASLKKLYGKSAAWRINKNAPTPAERETAEASIQVLTDRKEAAKVAMETRRRELLQDPEYQRLVAEHRSASDERDRAISISHTRRITVGRVSGLFFTVTGEGDSWAEALKAAQSKSN